MIGERTGRNAAALALSAAAFGSIIAVAPAAQASPAKADTVYADCAIGPYGKNNDGVYVSCGDVVGGTVRGRADCVAAPDKYTPWIGAWYNAWSGFCLFSMRGTILETRAS